MEPPQRPSTVNAGYAQVEASRKTLRLRKLAQVIAVTLFVMIIVVIAASSWRSSRSAVLRQEQATIQLNKDGATCSNGKFVAPPKPSSVDEHNGIALQDVCFHGDGPFHAFIIGDWGAVMDPATGRVSAASHLSHRWGQAYKFVWPIDEQAQQIIAKEMAKRAPVSKPDYVLNVGDNFYWAGVEDHCGAPDFTDMYSGGGTKLHKKKPVDQFKSLFEDMYTGPGIDGKQWLGVLGNHDYGGWRMDHAWDQAIGYTWSAQSSGRWMTPAMYWRVKVHYPDFSVDYYFMDTNVWDGLDPKDQSTHNICGEAHNPDGVHCPGGPSSLYDCPKWFEKLWEDQTEWLGKAVAEATSDWRIVVTHFPPYWGKHQWKHMAKQHELDLIVTGHRHSQFVRNKGDEAILIWPEWGKEAALKEGYTDFLDPTAWVVSGGGGGVTSEHVPLANGTDDQYGFMDLTLAKDKLIVEAISHSGELRHTIVVEPSFPHNPYYVSAADTAVEGQRWSRVGKSVHGACRSNTSGAGAGTVGKTFTLYTHVERLVDCKDLCSITHGCTGIEYNQGLADGRCEVWTQTIDWATAATGFICLHYETNSTSSDTTSTRSDANSTGIATASDKQLKF